MNRRPLGYIASAIKMASPFSGIVDEFPNASLAWSISRRLSNSYSGPLIDIIRESDSAVSSIGYDSNGDLSTADISSFCSGTTGYILKVYGQDDLNSGISMYGKGSGSALTELPVIYTGGSVVTLNGKPAAQITHPRMFQWSNPNINLSNILLGGLGDNKRVTMHVVGQQGSSTSPYKIVIEDSVDQTENLWMYESSGTERIDFVGSSAALGSTYSDGAQKHWVSQVVGRTFRWVENGTEIGTSVNASAQTTTKAGCNFFVGGLAFSTRNIEGYIQEIITWPSGISGSLLFDNADAYYSIV